ncbi:DUF4147 domain-containing protein [bacterium]|nr:DUF4147 domain-containing protein [bacterium]
MSAFHEKLFNDAMAIFESGLKAVHAHELVRQSFVICDSILTAGQRSYDLDSFERIIVIGAGKASAAMAEAVEQLLGDRISGGVVVTKYGHARPLNKIGIIEAGHPLPDMNGVRAGKAIIRTAYDATEKDLVIFLLSGGASVLMSSFKEGFLLDDAIKLNQQLLACGADIHEINTIRKCFSTIHGGKLAMQIYPATCLSLIISDVIGNRAADIGSGPTFPNAAFPDEVDTVLKKYKLDQWRSRIDNENADDGLFGNVNNIIIGDNDKALAECDRTAGLLGYECHKMGKMFAGEAREVAVDFINQALTLKSKTTKPLCYIGGGETTVTLSGHGKGGRNQEAALSAMVALKDTKSYLFFAAGTDGTDGPTDAAGAWVSNEIYNHSLEKKLDGVTYLKNHDSYSFFEQMETHVRTGPTMTNVMDIMMLILP